MNVPAVLAVFKAIRDPRLCLPHQVVPTLAHLPIPVSDAFSHYSYRKDRGAIAGHRGPVTGSLDKSTSPNVDIRAVVLDKDNCFATPDTNEIHPSCESTIKSLIETYTTSNLLIVSNSSGYTSRDPNLTAAAALERTTGIPVLHHNNPKPSEKCGSEILAHFKAKGVEVRPDQICVIGDRLFTDTVMANRMGCWSIWIKEGVRPDRGLVTRVEYGVERFLRNRGFQARIP